MSVLFDWDALLLGEVMVASWWTVRHTLWLAGGMLCLIAGAAGWAFLLRRKVAEQTAMIRQQLEREREMQAQYRDLFENADDMVYTHDAGGRFISVNKAAEKVLGYPREEFRSLDAFGLLASGHEEELRALMARSLPTEEKVAYELACTARDGEPRILEISARVMIKDGRPAGIHGVARDITQRKRAEARSAAFLTLGEQLSLARTSREAGMILLDVADRLLGWGACCLCLVSADQRRLTPVLAFDVVEGERREVGLDPLEVRAGDLEPQALQARAEEVLNACGAGSSERNLSEALRETHPKALGIPICNGGAVVGLLSVRGSKSRVYTPEEVQTFQSLADHCGGAIERIRAEEALHEKDRRFRALIENSSDGIFVRSADMKVLYASPSLTTLLGYEVKEFLGVNLLDALHPDDVDDARGLNEQVLANPGTRFECAGRLRHKDGMWRWLSGTSINLLHEPAVGGIIVNYRDVTERKLAEAELLQSEERFVRAFHASPVGVSITSQDGVFIDVNQRFLQVFGYWREEVVGRTAQSLRLWVNRADRDALIERIRRQEHVRDFEARFRRNTGEQITALVSVEKIELGSEPCLLFITHDITDRLSLESQLRHAQKMEAVGQLAAGVAHDFNNIMTVVRGYAGLLLDTVRPDGAVKEALEEISGAADRASNLTRQLLMFSRKRALQPCFLEANDVVRRVTQMLQRVLGENVVLQLDLMMAPPPILADQGMIEQVLVNLAVNARDAMPEGGKLSIRTMAASLDAERLAGACDTGPGEFLCMEVSDSGHGMDEETRARAFEPFFTTKEMGQGTGLGLASVYGIVKQHQGHIEVESQVGKGTTFRVFFPVSIQGQAAAPEVRQTGAIVSGGAETILLVEDEPALLDLSRRLLERHGYRLLTACSGVDALRVWEEHGDEVDLLLTDIVMPEGISGRELADRLLKERPDLRVLYVSGYSIDLTARDCVLREAVNFLPKPFSPQVLAKMVRDSLDRDPAAEGAGGRQF